MSFGDEGKASDASRPSIPPLLMGALVFWFACVVARQDFAFVLCCGGVSFLLLCAYALARIRFARNCAPLLVCSAALALGLACGSLQLASVDAQRAALLERSSLGEVQVLALADATQGEYGSQCLASAHVDSKTYKLLLSFSDSVQLFYGDALTVSGNLSLPDDSSYLDEKGAIAKLAVKNCSAAESRGVASLIGTWRKGLIASVSGSFDVIERAARDVVSPMDGDSGSDSGRKAGSSSLLLAGAIPLDELKSLILALAFGYRPSLSASLVYADFKLAGLAHLVAVSGAHLALVSGFVLVVLRRLGLGVRPLCCLVFGFLILYVFMVGVPVSCLRAAVMAALSLLSSLSLRRASSISALGLVIALFVAIDPVCATSVSFQLSVLATLGIVLFAPWCKWWLACIPHLPRAVSDSLAVTLSATIPTLPLTVSMFSQLPLVSPLANLAAGPILSVSMALCMFLVPLAFAPALLNLVMGVLLVVLGFFALMVHVLVSLPYACVPLSLQAAPAFVLGALACVAWWVCWPKPSARNASVLAFSCSAVVLCLLLVAGGSRVLFQGDDLVMLDVGQGDAFLIESKGKYLLIDTGRSDSKLLKGLASEGGTHLDGVLITHCDDDHYGSLDALRGMVAVDALYVAKGTLELDSAKAKEIEATSQMLTGRKAYELSCGSSLCLGNFTLEVISPEAVVDGGNQDSLTLIASVEEGGKTWKTLLCGDAESETLEMLGYKDLLCDIDVLKVGHHGSRVSLSDSLLEQLKPEVALISVGAGNRYGHPTKEALEVLDGCGARVFRSDELGKVICSFGDKGLKISAVG